MKLKQFGLLKTFSDGSTVCMAECAVTTKEKAIIEFRKHCEIDLEDDGTAVKHGNRYTVGELVEVKAITTKTWKIGDGGETFLKTEKKSIGHS